MGGSKSVADSGDNGGWTLVGRERRSKQRKFNQRPKAVFLGNGRTTIWHEFGGVLERHFDDYKAELEQSQFWASLHGGLEAQLSAFTRKCPVHLAGVGVGSFTTRRASGYQLAALELLKETFSIPNERFWLADPGFKEDDAAFARQRGYEGRLSARHIDGIDWPVGWENVVRLVVFMPHCDILVYGYLFEKILASKVKAEGECLVFGNHLQEYASGEQTYAVLEHHLQGGSVVEKKAVSLFEEHAPSTQIILSRFPSFERCPEAFDGQALMRLMTG